jgi:DNA-binding winged helix-turn-helix (wHTH) protein/TolB-like protein
MTNNNPINQTSFNCAGLEFDLDLGSVKNALGETQRLSPINLKLLAYLVSHQDEVISRTELFDAIWPNQIVSDDVLTRAVSDIRTQLAKLDDASKFIETLPKRGYRWTIEIVPSIAQNPNLMDAPTANPIVFAESAGQSTRSVDRRFIIHGLSYILAALFLAFAIMWWLTQSMGNQISLAVLPTLSDRPQTEHAATLVNENMLQLLRKNPRLKLLSTSAIASRPQNPFPYFFKEFGAKWVLESRVKDGDGFYEFELSLVDARTGIEVRNTRIEFANNTDLLTKLAKKVEVDFLAEDLGY